MSPCNSSVFNQQELSVILLHILIFQRSVVILSLWIQYFCFFYFPESSPLLNGISGLGAGVISKGAVYPLDLIKKRMQVQGFEEARRPFGRLHFCSGLTNCVQTIIREEGWLAFYKGFLPSLAKAGCVSALTFGFYEIGRHGISWFSILHVIFL